MLNYNLRLRQLYDHINQRRYFMLRLMPINMLISTNIASIKLIKRTEDTNRAENKVYTEKIVQKIYITEKTLKRLLSQS
jgi:hypothetical protein